MSNSNIRDALVRQYLALLGTTVSTTGLNVVDLSRKIAALLEGGAVGGSGGVNSSITSEADMIATSAVVGNTSFWFNTTDKTLEFWEYISDAVTVDTPGEFRRVTAAAGWLRRGI